MAFPPPLSHLSRFSCAVGGKDRRRRSSVCGGGTGTPPTEGFAPSVFDGSVSFRQCQKTARIGTCVAFMPMVRKGRPFLGKIDSP